MQQLNGVSCDPNIWTVNCRVPLEETTEAWFTLYGKIQTLKYNLGNYYSIDSYRGTVSGPKNEPLLNWKLTEYSLFVSKALDIELF